ncbi:hypothetical protein TCON_1103 [Astathelohania contejeani]|uniref:Uncharacterized protein n=1 Tax=Astathelohania contejeani TaxID=164912 RepID=A0ABQ7HZY1_9MICR|nr:hypothetical protein TCON_1103 [Thelohania contejeani]
MIFSSYNIPVASDAVIDAIISIQKKMTAGIQKINNTFPILENYPMMTDLPDALKNDMFLTFNSFINTENLFLLPQEKLVEVFFPNNPNFFDNNADITWVAYLNIIRMHISGNLDFICKGMKLLTNPVNNSNLNEIFLELKKGLGNIPVDEYDAYTLGNIANVLKQRNHQKGVSFIKTHSDMLYQLNIYFNLESNFKNRFDYKDSTCYFA